MTWQPYTGILRTTDGKTATHRPDPRAAANLTYGAHVRSISISAKIESNEAMAFKRWCATRKLKESVVLREALAKHTGLTFSAPRKSVPLRVK